MEQFGLSNPATEEQGYTVDDEDEDETRSARQPRAPR
jgi:hypothetical protein